jgi:copper(I)-binding protein
MHLPSLRFTAMRQLLAAPALFIALAAQAQVQVGDPWVRATVASCS